MKSLPELVAIARRYRRIAGIALGIAVLILWQRGFSTTTAKVDEHYRISASTGINREPQFVFFLYHTGYFPIASDAKIRADTKEEALRLLREEPKSLKQDEGSTFRSGDRGRTFLYLLDVWMRGKSLEPSIRPTHMLAFTTALCALFLAFAWIRHGVAGFALCLILGSNSFQLFAVYRQENVFSWAITGMILLLAINLPVMWPKRPPWYPLVAVIASGLSLALIRTIRSEPTPLIVAIALMHATAAGLSRLTKLKLVVVLAVTFSVGSWGSLRYLDHKLETSKKVVAAAGGSPYSGPVVAYHEFWHAVFCGLGDFDKKKGYAWDDKVAYRHALPILKRTHPELKLDPYGAVQAWSYDADGKYPFLFSESPGYHEIIRDKVLHDIRTDPLWYMDILKKRVWRILTQTTPVGIALSDEQYLLSGSAVGLLCVPLALFLVFARRWFLLKLLVFSTPLSVGPLLIYSDGGMWMYSTFHLFGAFIIGLLAVEGARGWLGRRYRPARL